MVSLSPKDQTLSLSRVCWWVNTSGTWNHSELAAWYIEAIWDNKPATLATDILHRSAPTTLRMCWCELAFAA